MVGNKHAAAYAFAGQRLIVGDRAAVHIKRAARDSHAAAFNFAVTDRRIVTDRAAVHIEFGVFV